MMGNFQGRILQAYYDGDKVVIRETELYHFAPVENAQRFFEIFAQHMASDLTGDIHELLQGATKESR